MCDTIRDLSAFDWHEDDLCVYLDVASKIIETVAFELAEVQPASMVERLLSIAREIEIARTQL